MLDEEKSNYAILKDKDDLLAAETVCIVKGRSSAEMTVDRLNRNLTEEEKRAGWRHFLQKTTRKVPTAKKAATGKKKRAGREIARRRAR